MRLWIESEHRSLVGVGEGVCADVVRTCQTEDEFFAVFVGCPQGGEGGRKDAALVADKATTMLARGTSLDTVVETILAVLPRGEHMPLSILQILEGFEAHMVECDAPPLLLIQGGQLVVPSVLEEVSHGRLIRRCQFLLRDGDHLVMVSEGFLRCPGWRWGWPDVAIAVQRWTDTRCDAEELAGALIRTYRRLDPETPSLRLRQDVTVVAMHVRPVRTATVWTGPPTDSAQDEAALGKLMAEQDGRIICGDTTAQIAERLSGGKLEMEPRPANGWDEVPPVSRMEGVSLVTEGLITLRKACERMVEAKGVRDLPRGEDGATRLARALLMADKLHFIVGLAANPQQVGESGVPLRKGIIEALMHDLGARGKLVSVEYV